MKKNWYVESLNPQNFNQIPPITLFDSTRYPYGNITPLEIQLRQSMAWPITSQNLCNMNYEHIIKHEAIVAISTTFRINDEKQLEKAVKQALYLAPQIDIDPKQVLTEATSLVGSYFNDTLDNQSSTYKILQEWSNNYDQKIDSIINFNSDIISNLSINKEDYKTIETKKKILSDLYFDKTLMEKYTELAEKTISKTLNTEEFSNLQRLTIRNKDNRKALLVVGGAACGKGSVTAELKKGRTYEDQVELNPDLYKSIILPHNEIDRSKYNHEQTRLAHGSITHPESSVIFDKIAERWQKMANVNAAPNILMDVARAGRWMTNTLSSGGTTVEIHAADLDSNIAIHRSYQRGEATGRFMPTKELLRGHQEQVDLQSDALTKRTPSSNLVVYNSEGQIGDPLKIVLLGDKDNKTISIFDAKTMIDYLSKKQLNINATSPEELYENHSNLQLTKNLLEFANNFKVIFHNEHKQPILSIHNEGKGVIANIFDTQLFNTELISNPNLLKLVTGLKENTVDINIDLFNQAIKIGSNITALSGGDKATSSTQAVIPNIKAYQSQNNQRER
ncbi:zeta toxin family protein [Rickettsiales endosymbiont of Stachyamoeba lipophora]|uniref:zeta toxin family protein n=1 Tax=Rickettsiales endosymbiont of Stachyamoeba lipophora TaxID=2486578 RepID=UPI000F652EBE|nr:zeta toxin family protein [Rickettsiales endosymbiont of Stachyamoeba lipophora]AZL15762.1 hypothetical protein EF513_04280 [Rickettsiales endosymbiont of Stachyamoeba lipophora]